MTHPLTLREKVAQTITYNPVYGKLWEGSDPTKGHIYYLASGSGDHAELARLADMADWMADGDPGTNGSVLLSASVASEHASDLRALLAEVAALRAESEGRAKAHAKEIAGLYDRANTAGGELDAVSSAIGTVRFMDPPDGGDVHLSEQVRRMASALTEAERKLAEAVGLLREAVEPYEHISNVRAFEVMENGPATRLVAIRTFLSKEAERG